MPFFPSIQRARRGPSGGSFAELCARRGRHLQTAVLPSASLPEGTADAALRAVPPELPYLCRVPFPAPGWQLPHLEWSRARWLENSFSALSAFSSRSGCFPAWCTPLLALGVSLVNSAALGLRSVPFHGAASAWVLGLVIHPSGLIFSGFESSLLKICWKFPSQAPARCPGAWQLCLPVSFFFFFSSLTRGNWS